MGIIKKYPAIASGVGITFLFLALAFFRADFLDSVELTLYDVMMRLRAAPESPSPVVMVDIDDDAIEKLGRWPWPRSLIAKGIEKITLGAPKAIGLNLILSEPEESAGLAAIRELEAMFTDSVLDASGDAGAAFLQEIKAAESRLDNDNILTASLAASGRVILPIFFKSTGVAGPVAGKPGPILVSNAIKHVSSGDGAAVRSASEIMLPIPSFLAASKGIGHINLSYDMDGTARREMLIYRYGNLYIPSYTLRLAAFYMDIPMDQVRVTLGADISLGTIRIPTTLLSELLVSFKGPRGSFKSYGFFDVINDKIPFKVFKNKLVLVSASAAGLINPLSTPTDATMPLGEFSAHTLSSILNRQTIQQPPWSGQAELLLILFIGLVITFLLPRFRALTASVVFWTLLALAGGSLAYLFVSEGLWVPMTYPIVQLVLGYIGVLSIKYFVTETSKEKVEGESAETNRMLGLSFQSQGMLDMAFDKFRRVPVDKEMKDVLYNACPGLRAKTAVEQGRGGVRIHRR